jgi:hypothetical protein
MKKHKPIKQAVDQDIEYIAPSTTKVDAYVQEVCRALADLDPIYNKHEAREDLKQLLKVILEIQVEQLNKRSKSLDNSSAQE